MKANKWVQASIHKAQWPIKFQVPKQNREKNRRFSFNENCRQAEKVIFITRKCLKAQGDYIRCNEGEGGGGLIKKLIKKTLTTHRARYLNVV